MTPFPTPEDVEADLRLCRNQSEVDLLLAFRSMSDRRKAAFITLIRCLAHDDAGTEAAAIGFLQASGLSRRRAVRRARLVLSRMAA